MGDALGVLALRLIALIVVAFMMMALVVGASMVVTMMVLSLMVVTMGDKNLNLTLTTHNSPEPYS